MLHGNHEDRIDRFVDDNPELDGTLKISDLLETHKHSTQDILNECLEHEKEAIDIYYELLKQVENKSIYLEEYCRTMICAEEQDYQEMVKMLND